MTNNLIQWPRAKYWDKAWNPIIGCKPCSTACENCYAAAMMRRFGAADFSPRTTTRVNPPRSGVVFCGNMTDLFGEWLEPFDSMEFFSRLFHFTRDGSPRPNEATYLFLTKRVSRMADALCNYTDVPNALFGFTAENQEWYDRRFAEFRKIPTKFRGWLSAEPLLGPIDLGLNHVYPPEAAPFQWVVVGCESGSGRRPCPLEWVESVVEQCLDAGVRVFVKQICLPDGRFVNTLLDFPKHLRIRQVPWAKQGETKK